MLNDMNVFLSHTVHLVMVARARASQLCCFLHVVTLTIKFHQSYYTYLQVTVTFNNHVLISLLYNKMHTLMSHLFRINTTIQWQTNSITMCVLIKPLLWLPCRTVHISQEKKFSGEQMSGWNKMFSSQSVTQLYFVLSCYDLLRFQLWNPVTSKPV